MYCSKGCHHADQGRHSRGRDNSNYRHGNGRQSPPRKKRVRVTPEQIAAAIDSEGNFAAAAAALGINRKTVAGVAKRLRIENPGRRPVDTDRVFSVKDRRSSGTRGSLRKHNLIQYSCSLCGLGDSWCKAKLVLELDHINGDPCDNRLENLRWLCPNCHSQTTTYCGRKRKEVTST